ncbi:MAG: hypothetical protein V3T88_06260 [Nitrosomonadaceae bacterium]
MTTLHTGEIGRFDLLTSIVDGDIFLIRRNGELRQATAEDVKNYFSSNLNVIQIDFSESPFQSLTSDELIEVDATDGPVVVLLFGFATGENVMIKKIDSSANTVTVNGNGVNIDDAATQVITTQYNSLFCVAGTVQWGLN